MLNLSSVWYYAMANLVDQGHIAPISMLVMSKQAHSIGLTLIPVGWSRLERSERERTSELFIIDAFKLSWRSAGSLL